MAKPNDASLNTFDAVYEYLTTKYGFPLLPFPSPNPHDRFMSHTIAELSIHPTLEAILHLLNADLPSAHFLCRHMQNKPAWEGMYIHGLLHRIEGDYENTRAWYGDVEGSDCFKHIWSEGGLDAANSFIDSLKPLLHGGKKGQSATELQFQSQQEFERLVDWCKRRFGIGSVESATEAWVDSSEEQRQMAAKMIVGGEGWRQF